MMKKQILNFGKALGKSELKSIHGGFDPCTVPHITIPGDNCFGGGDGSGGDDGGPIGDPLCLNGWVWSWEDNSCVPF